MTRWKREVTLCPRLPGVTDGAAFPPTNVEDLTPNTCECDLIWENRVFAVDQVKKRSWGWPWIQYDCAPIKRGDLDTETYTQGECHVKIGIMFPSQGTPKISSKAPEANRDAWNRGDPRESSQPSGGTNATNTLTLCFQPPILWDNMFLLFKPSST